MNNLEEEIRKALARCDPPDGFTDRLAARIAALPAARKSPLTNPAWRWLAAAAAAVFLVTGLAFQQHEHQVQGEAAKQKLLTAMRITGSKLLPHTRTNQTGRKGRRQSMKKLMLKIAIAALSLSALCAAQDFKLPDLDKLAHRAKETVDVTLDQSMLQLASGFLSKDDPDEAQVKKLVAKLKGLYVRSYEFAKNGEYSPSDVDLLRSQLKTPAWSRIVGVKSVEGENTEIYVQKNGDQIGGLVVLAAEPKELTIVHIDGPINPEDLTRLSGHLGIPELAKAKHKSDKKED